MNIKLETGSAQNKESETVSKENAAAIDSASTEGVMEDTPEMVDECTAPSCVFVFISAIPGSTVLINGNAKEDGLKRDIGTIHFAPVGERKPHPIIDGAMHTDFGAYATDDPKVAWVLNQSIAKGNAQFFAYCPTDPAHAAQFQPEVYAIKIPGHGADITL